MKNFSLPCVVLRAALAQRGLCISDLARTCRCTPGHVYNVIRGFRKSPRVVREIEKFIGQPIFTNPSKQVKVRMRNSGMLISVSAIQAPMYEHAFALLSSADPEGKLTVAEKLGVLERDGKPATDAR